MKKLILSWIVCLCLAFIMVACQPTTPPKATGSLSVTLTPLAPWVKDKSGGDKSGDAKSASARAWMVASYATLTLTPGNIHWNVTPSSGAIEDTHLGIPVGTYTLQVDIYNNIVSASVPVVTGVQGGITIVSDLTAEAAVVCFPNSPVTLLLNTVSSTFSLAQLGEKWFTYTPLVTDSYRVTLTSVTGDADLYVFGPDGLIIIGSEETFSPENVDIELTSGQAYYFDLLGWPATANLLVAPTPTGNGGLHTTVN
jgi:hypothetical protein